MYISRFPPKSRMESSWKVVFQTVTSHHPMRVVISRPSCSTEITLVHIVASRDGRVPTWKQRVSRESPWRRGAVTGHPNWNFRAYGKNKGSTCSTYFFPVPERGIQSRLGLMRLVTTEGKKQQFFGNTTELWSNFFAQFTINDIPTYYCTYIYDIHIIVIPISKFISIYLHIYISTYLYFYISIYLYIYISIYLYIYISL